MRENRLYGSEGGGAKSNWLFLPLLFRWNTRVGPPSPCARFAGGEDMCSLHVFEWIAHASGVIPNTMSNRAANSPMRDPLTGLKSTIKDSRALRSVTPFRMRSFAFWGSPLT
jgi:hypothetical protein